MDVKLNQQVRLDLIRIDGGTQQRDIDEDIEKQYTTLLKDGYKFPPVEVVFDGKDHWLWDGFHRYYCAKMQLETTIVANITKGTLRDAIWLSFSANKAHGFPRQKGVAKHIVEQILTDKTWAKKSQTAIARHVGVTKQYVSQVKDAIAQESSTATPVLGKNGVSEPESTQGSSTLPLLRDDEIEVKSKHGIPYTQKSQAKEHKVKEPPKDSVGQVIPEPLGEVYMRRTVISGLITDVEKILHFVKKAQSERDPVFTMLNTTAFQSHCTNLRRTLKSARPYAVCCYCGGDAKNCKACEGFGFLNEHTYRKAPKELQK